jgi:hypothetical protein
MMKKKWSFFYIILLTSFIVLWQQQLTEGSKKKRWHTINQITHKYLRESSLVRQKGRKEFVEKLLNCPFGVNREKVVLKLSSSMNRWNWNFMMIIPQLLLLIYEIHNVSLGDDERWCWGITWRPAPFLLSSLIRMHSFNRAIFHL